MNRILLAIPLVLLAGVARGECDNLSLFVDKDATGVKYRDCWQVEYVVAEAFPGVGLLERLTNALQSQGWQKLDFDPLEPQASDHLVHAWTVHRATDEQQTRVDQWLGWYNRKDKSRIQVTLRYLGREAEDDGMRGLIATITFVSPEQWESRPK